MKANTVVLVVEDEALVRLDVISQIEDEGFTVIEAADADAAIRILETNPDVTILFTDIDMPGSMDGLKLSAAVRDRWPPVKIVVTSGHRMVEITDLPDGSVFHAKPYRHAEVVASFRELTALD
ncbi:response regulator [Devosia alba]|uniref:response regulator n=1 Tax=Devosia alba TaxID=3152360 RepID=UPI0032646760